MHPRRQNFASQVTTIPLNSTSIDLNLSPTRVMQPRFRIFARPDAAPAPHCPFTFPIPAPRDASRVAGLGDGWGGGGARAPPRAGDHIPCKYRNRTAGIPFPRRGNSIPAVRYIYRTAGIQFPRRGNGPGAGMYPHVAHICATRAHMLRTCCAHARRMSRLRRATSRVATP